MDGIEGRLPGLDRTAVILGIARIVASIGDGHTQMFLGSDEKIGFHALPVRFFWFEEGITVVAAPAKEEWALGKRVSFVGDVPVAEVVERLRPLVNRDNEMTVRDVLPGLLRLGEVLHALGLSAEPGAVTFELEGDSRRLLLHSQPAPLVRWSQRLPATPLWQSRPGKTYWFEVLRERRLLYVQFNAVQDDPGQSVAAFFAEVFAVARKERVRSFVLDLRLNNGGDNTLLDPIVNGLSRAPFNREGHLFVITGRLTFSAAMNLATRLEHKTHAIFVGEPTGSRPNHYGEAISLTLPSSGITVRVSTRFWQDSRPDDTRPWIAPRLLAPPTAAAFGRGTDPAMNAILDSIGGR